MLPVEDGPARPESQTEVGVFGSVATLSSAVVGALTKFGTEVLLSGR